MHNSWKHAGGERIRGDFIDTRNFILKGDTMVFDTSNYKYGEKGMDDLILKWQYFSTMKVMDPKTKKTGKYSMKGVNWTNYPKMSIRV